MKIRQLLLLLLILLVAAEVTPIAAWDWLWAHQFVSSQFLNAYGGAADASGVYVTGWVAGDLPGTNPLGQPDAYVRKIDFSGDVLWTRRMGTTSLDASQGLAVADDGVYITGATCGAFPGYVQAGGCDVFVAKLTPGGALLWVTQFGTSALDLPYEYGPITVHASGVYVAGKTRGTFPGATPAGGPNTFLARVDRSSGAGLWVRQFGAADPGFFTSGGVGADETGVAVVANSNTAGPAAMEVRKYTFDGTVLWSRVFDTTTRPCGYPAFALTSHRGQVYVIGQIYEWALTGCDPQPLGQANVVGLLQKLDARGETVWQRRIKAGIPGVEGGTYQRFTGAKVVHVTDDGIFVGANVKHGNFAGYVSRTSRSDRSQCGDTGAVENFLWKGFDGYVRRYDFDGNVAWTHQFGSSLYELVSGVGSNGNRLYAVGLTRCAVAEGADPESGALVDAFVVSFAIDPITQSGRVQLIVGNLETLSDAGRIASGDFGALTSQLDSALAALDGSNAPAARASLLAFVQLVENHKSTNRIPVTEADGLISAATVIAGEL
jgi:hypothetical protein